jgi:hypothetical protein
MRNRATTIGTAFGLVVAAASSGAAAIAAPSGATATVFYVSPTGTGTTCSAAAPCGLRTGLSTATPGSSVQLGPGSYRTPATAFTQALNDGGDAVYIHGEAGEPAPVIYSKAPNALGLSPESRLSHVVVVSAGSGYGLSALGATVDHVEVWVSAAGAIACSVQGTISDSICSSSGNGGVAMSYSNDAASPVTSNAVVVGVTALATGAGGIGIHLTAGHHVTYQVTATNTITVGTKYGVEAEATTASSYAIVKLDHCDAGQLRATFPQGTATISSTNNVDDPPVFVDPAAGDYRVKKSSPTVDAGADVAGGDTDLAGNPRVLGSAPDIGAFELPEKPDVKKFKVGKVTKHAARFSIKVNPEGLATKTSLVVRKPGKNLTPKPVRAGHGRTFGVVRLAVHGLKHDTKYQVVAKATNSAGQAVSASKSLHTH